LSLGDIQLRSGFNDSLDRVRVQKRLAAKGHHGLDVVLCRNLTHRIRGDLRVDTLSARRVITLRAMLAPARAGVGHDEFYLVQIFKIQVHIFLMHVVMTQAVNQAKITIKPLFTASSSHCLGLCFLLILATGVSIAPM
jgi:hypothetical protein